MDEYGNLFVEGKTTILKNHVENLTPTLNEEELEIVNNCEVLRVGYDAAENRKEYYSNEGPCFSGIIENLPNLKKLVVHNYFNKQINFKFESLPNLKSIKIGDRYNKNIIISDKIEELKLGECFNSSIILESNNFYESMALYLRGHHMLGRNESNLINLTLGHCFDGNLVLNNKLESLNIGDMFDRELTLNENLKSLTIGNGFNKKIKLNKNLKLLNLGNNFDQDIEFVESLEKVKLGKKFNKRISLDKNLEELILGDLFNSDIDLNLNEKLKIINLGSYNKKKINFGKDLINLKKIHSSPHYERKLLIPKNLDVLIIENMGVNYGKIYKKKGTNILNNKLKKYYRLLSMKDGTIMYLANSINCLIIDSCGGKLKNLVNSIEKIINFSYGSKIIKMNKKIKISPWYEEVRENIFL